MEWQDKGIIIGLKNHGETGLIVELMTHSHGRHKGIVRGGRTRRQMPLLQPGNKVEAHWRARLSEHMGQYRLEALDFAAAMLMQEALPLYALQNIAAHLRLLPERDPHPALYEILPLLLTHFDRPLLAGEIFARFEMRLLDELGFGLDLSRCAATGERGRLPFEAGRKSTLLAGAGGAAAFAGAVYGETAADFMAAEQIAAAAKAAELIYVSPKSARAVSRAAGEAWKDKLLPLPRFLLSERIRAENFADLAAAFRLSGFFLDRHIWQARGMAIPPFREAFLHCLQTELEKDGKNI